MLNSNSEIKKFVASVLMCLISLIIALNIFCCHSASATKGGRPLQKTNSSENKRSRSNRFTTSHNLDLFDDSDSSRSSTTSSSSDDSSDSDEFDPYEFMLFQRMIWTALAEKFSDIPFSSEQDEDLHDNVTAQNNDVQQQDTFSNTNGPDSPNEAFPDDINTTPLKVFHKNSPDCDCCTIC